MRAHSPRKLLSATGQAILSGCGPMSYLRPAMLTQVGDMRHVLIECVRTHANQRKPSINVGVSQCERTHNFSNSSNVMGAEILPCSCESISWRAITKSLTAPMLKRDVELFQLPGAGTCRYLTLPRVRNDRSRVLCEV
jgi:hypothetical protein